MDESEVKRQIYGKFEKDPFQRILERAYYELPKGSFAQTIIKQSLDALRYSGKSEECVKGAIVALATTMEQYKKLLEEKKQLEAPAILVTNKNDDDFEY